MNAQDIKDKYSWAAEEVENLLDVIGNEEVRFEERGDWLVAVFPKASRYTIRQIGNALKDRVPASFERHKSGIVGIKI